MANVQRPGACDQCGQPLPEQQGAGRRRRYCGATCRSAARRQRSAGVSRAPSVNQNLTTRLRKDSIDNVPAGRAGAPSEGLDPARGAAAGPESGQEALPQSGTGALAAVGLAQAIARSAEEGLAMAVKRARDAGHTWAEIGQQLGTSRQAAFQRFGRPADPRTGEPMVPALPDAGDRAMGLIDDLISGRWDAASATFSAALAEKLDAAQFAAVWAQVIGLAGRCERRGTPSVFQAGDYTVADIPLYFEAGERIGRISYDRDAQVAGIFFLPAGAA